MAMQKSTALLWIVVSAILATVVPARILAETRIRPPRRNRPAPRPQPQPIAGSQCVVRVVVDFSSTHRRQQHELCSGALLAEQGLILSAAHCVAPIEAVHRLSWQEHAQTVSAIRIFDPRGRAPHTEADVVGIDLDADLVLLRARVGQVLPAATHRGCHLATSFSQRAALVALGYIGRDTPRLKTARLHAVEVLPRESRSRTWLVSDSSDAASSFEKGMSGGPVLDPTGQIVGIISGRFRGSVIPRNSEHCTRNLARPVSVLRDFLAGAQVTSGLELPTNPVPQLSPTGTVEATVSGSLIWYDTLISDRPFVVGQFAFASLSRDLRTGRSYPDYPRVCVNVSVGNSQSITVNAYLLTRERLEPIARRKIRKQQNCVRVNREDADNRAVIAAEVVYRSSVAPITLEFSYEAEPAPHARASQQDVSADVSRCFIRGDSSCILSTQPSVNDNILVRQYVAAWRARSTPLRAAALRARLRELHPNSYWLGLVDLLHVRADRSVDEISRLLLRNQDYRWSALFLEFGMCHVSEPELALFISTVDLVGQWDSRTIAAHRYVSVFQDGPMRQYLFNAVPPNVRESQSPCVSALVPILRVAPP